MKPTLTFDKTALNYILKTFGKIIDKKGYIRNSEGKKEKCGICKKDLNIKNFAGVIKDVGFICDNISCLVAISGFYAMKDKKKQLGEWIRLEAKSGSMKKLLLKNVPKIKQNEQKHN